MLQAKTRKMTQRVMMFAVLTAGLFLVSVRHIAVSGEGLSDAASPKPNVERTNQRLKGRIKWYNDVKAYGMITPDGGGSEFFLVAMTSRTSISMNRDASIMLKESM